MSCALIWSKIELWYLNSQNVRQIQTIQLFSIQKTMTKSKSKVFLRIAQLYWRKHASSRYPINIPIRIQVEKSKTLIVYMKFTMNWVWMHRIFLRILLKLSKFLFSTKINKQCPKPKGWAYGPHRRSNIQIIPIKMQFENNKTWIVYLKFTMDWVWMHWLFLRILSKLSESLV